MLLCRCCGESAFEVSDGSRAYERGEGGLELRAGGCVRSIGLIKLITTTFG